MNLSDVRAWIEDQIPQAREDAANSIRVAANSYGAGYDTGWLKALEHILQHLNEGDSDASSS
jgi:hypothetical protein